MTRKRLTAATLDSERQVRVGGQAVDIVSRILGPGASDQEIVTAGRVLRKGIGDRGIAGLHRLASRVAAESGEDFPGDLEDEGKNDPRETQEFVAEHEVTPDHAVLDVVMHERNPTQNPTASKLKTKKRRAADEEDEPDLEEPDDLEMDADDHVDDDDDLDDDIEDELDEAEDDDDLEDEAEDDVVGSEDDEMDDDVEGDDLDDELEDEDLDDEGDDDITDEMDDDVEGDGDDDGEFTMEDMEDLENMGVDGVLTSSHTGSASDVSRARRTREGGVIKGRQAHLLAREDSARDADRAYQESLEIERANSERFGDDIEGQPRRKAGKKVAGRKASRKAPPAPKSRKATKTPSQFRPARTRVASADVSDNEFDAVWNEPDISGEFDS